MSTPSYRGAQGSGYPTSWLGRVSARPPRSVQIKGSTRLKLATSTDGPLAQGSIAMKQSHCNAYRSPFNVGTALQCRKPLFTRKNGLLILLTQLATISRPSHRLDRLGFTRRCTRGCVGPLTHVGTGKRAGQGTAPSHRQLTQGEMASGRPGHQVHGIKCAEDRV
jgi:hypothetical protein